MVKPRELPWHVRECQKIRRPATSSFLSITAVYTYVRFIRRKREKTKVQLLYTASIDTCIYMYRYIQLTSHLLVYKYIGAMLRSDAPPARLCI